MISYPAISPVLVKLGPVEIRWYSVMYIIGLVAVFLFFRHSSRRGTLKMTDDQIETTMIVALLGMIVGARLAYVLIYNLPHYLQHPKEIIAVWEGGLSFHGGFIGMVAALWAYCRQQKIDFLSVADHMALMVPVGIFFGRIGNFINGELWGRVTEAPWGMIFPGGGPLPRHPSQLYEAFLEGFLLMSILWIIRLTKPKTGIIAGSFIIGYGIARFFAEFFREPDAQLGSVAGPFSMGQILCVFMWAIGTGMLVYALNRASDRKSHAA